MSKRQPHTSSRDYETSDLDNSLEKYGELSREFAEAKLSSEPREIQQEDIAEKEPFTGTSTAKEVLERRVDSLLEQYDMTTKEFNSAGNQEQSDNTRQQGRGSKMVGEDRPQHNAEPSKEIAERVDRISFDDRWEREVNEAQQEQTNERANER